MISTGVQFVNDFLKHKFCIVSLQLKSVGHASMYYETNGF